MTNETTTAEPPYSEWTVTELRDEFASRGLQVPSGAVKADLVTLLEENDAEEDEEFEEVPAVGIHPFGTCVPLSPCPHMEEPSTEAPNE